MVVEIVSTFTLLYTSAVAYVYLLHFQDAETGEAKHYVGYARDRSHLEERISKHRAGTGARWVKNGHSIELVRLWRDATPEHERKFKTLGAVNFCPRCSKFIPSASVKGRASIERVA